MPSHPLDSHMTMPGLIVLFATNAAKRTPLLSTLRAITDNAKAANATYPISFLKQNHSGKVGRSVEGKNLSRPMHPLAVLRLTWYEQILTKSFSVQARLPTILLPKN